MNSAKETESTMREYSTEAQYVVGENETVVTAMQELGVPRVLMLSSLGAGGSGALLPAPLRLITRAVLLVVQLVVLAVMWRLRGRDG